MPEVKYDPNDKEPSKQSDNTSLSKAQEAAQLAETQKKEAEFYQKAAEANLARDSATLGMSPEEYKSNVNKLKDTLGKIEQDILSFIQINRDTLPDAVEYKRLFNDWWVATHTNNEHDKASSDKLLKAVVSFELANKQKYHPLQFKYWGQQVIIEWLGDLMNLFISKSETVGEPH